MSRSSERELIDNLESEIKERLKCEIDQGNIKDMSHDQIMDKLNDMSGEIIMSVYEWLASEYHDKCKQAISELLPTLELNNKTIKGQSKTTNDLLTAYKQDFENLISSSTSLLDAFEEYKINASIHHPDIYDKLTLEEIKEGFAGHYLRNDDSIIPHYRMSDAHFFMIISILSFNLRTIKNE